MKKTTKKFIALVMSIISIYSLTVAVSAVEPPDGFELGLLDTKFTSMTKMYDDDNSLLYVFREYRTGDLNENGIIEAADARICLRTAANLQEIVSNKRFTADVNKDGLVNSADARIILRASAGIEEIATKVYNDFADVSYTLSLKSGNQYYWQCVCDAENVNVKEYRIDKTDSEISGAGVDQFFVFAAKNEGTHTVKFIYANSNQTDIIEEFEVVLDC